jgi:hypothetical protein
VLHALPISVLDLITRMILVRSTEHVFWIQLRKNSGFCSIRDVIIIIIVIIITKEAEKSNTGVYV